MVALLHSFTHTWKVPVLLHKQAKWWFIVKVAVPFYTFSMVRNGLGLVLTIFGNLSFVITFQCCLYSIREQQSTRQSRIFSFLSSHFLISCYLMAIFLFSSMFTLFYDVEIYHIHIINITHTTVLCILVPKFQINQDPVLKLYVSVYHHQPPPVLPWQLPKDFPHDSVKLICAKPKYE